MQSKRWTIKKCLLFFTTVFSSLFLAYITFTIPEYRNKPCAPVLLIEKSHDESLCGDVMSGRISAVAFASQFSWCRRHDEISDEMYDTMTEDCPRFRAKFGYVNYSVTEEEKNFPIAFSILMHENLEQTERLLRLIYRPHNIYCIHVDAKSPSSLHLAAQRVAGCFGNVFIAPRAVDIHWGEFSLLEAELVCLRALFDGHREWKYYMNLMSREFPLRTNRELVEIFRAYNGANDIDGTMHRRPILWTKFVWKNENWRTGQEKTVPPHNFLIGKGSTHVAASRAFIDYALNSREARDLLEWMKDIRAPDEHFFPTLNHNSHLGVPGSYKGDPDLKWFYARMKIWQSKTDVCRGQWVRYICNLGVGDLPQLTTARQLFLNKIRLEQDPTAFYCLELWYKNRTRSEAQSGGVGDNFNVSFYANLPFVLNHV